MSRELYTITPAGEVAPRPWVLRREGEVLGHHDTQDAAAETARTVARYRLYVLGKLAEVQVHGKDGKVRLKDTYGDDPPETKG